MHATIGDSGAPVQGTAASAVDRADADLEEIAEIWLVPFERPAEAKLGGMQIAKVLVKFVDGREVTHDVWCGVSFSPIRDPNAELLVSSGIDHDVPRSGAPPDGCATLPPTPLPEAFEDASALEVEALEILIDGEGRYEVEVGRATLPNGYHRTLDVARRPAPDRVLGRLGPARSTSRRSGSTAGRQHLSRAVRRSRTRDRARGG